MAFLSATWPLAVGVAVQRLCGCGAAAYELISVRLPARIIVASKCKLLIGAAGVGKTTVLRDVARLSIDAYKSVVVVVDTTSLYR